MKLRIMIAGLAMGFAASFMPVAAHHSVVDTFDTGREVTIRGVVTKIEWTNPHVRLLVDAGNVDGTVSNWILELPPPNALTRTFGVDFVKVADQVTVVSWRAKDGSRLGSVLDLTLPGGRVINFSRETTRGWTMVR